MNFHIFTEKSNALGVCRAFFACFLFTVFEKPKCQTENGNLKRNQKRGWTGTAQGNSIQSVLTNFVELNRKKYSFSMISVNLELILVVRLDNEK